MLDVPGAVVALAFEQYLESLRAKSDVLAGSRQIFLKVWRLVPSFENPFQTLTAFLSSDD